MLLQTREILTAIQSLLEPEPGNCTLTAENNMLFLRLFPALFPNNSSHVYMEICLVPYSDELTIAQIYTTLMPKAGPHTNQLPAHFADWNLHSFAGAYGLYGKDKQLYHKHNVVLFTEESAEDQVKAILSSVSLVMDELARRLPEAVQIVFDVQS